jgi:hypothetical protein
VMVNDGIDNDNDGQQVGSSMALMMVMMPMKVKTAPGPREEIERPPDRGLPMFLEVNLIIYFIMSQIIRVVGLLPCPLQDILVLNGYSLLDHLYFCVAVVDGKRSWERY